MKITIEPNKIIIILEKETKFSELETVVNGLKSGFPDREVYINGKVEWHINQPKEPIKSPVTLPKKEEPNPFNPKPYESPKDKWWDIPAWTGYVKEDGSVNFVLGKKLK